MELPKDSVVLPSDEFAELQNNAYANTHVPTLGERVANTTQAYAVFGGMAAAVVAGTWGWAKAINWLDNKKFERETRKAEKHQK